MEILLINVGEKVGALSNGSNWILDMCPLNKRRKKKKTAPHIDEIVKVCQPFQFPKIDIPFDTTYPSLQLTWIQ